MLFELIQNKKRNDAAIVFAVFDTEGGFVDEPPEQIHERVGRSKSWLGKSKEDYAFEKDSRLSTATGLRQANYRRHRQVVWRGHSANIRL